MVTPMVCAVTAPLTHNAIPHASTHPHMHRRADDRSRYETDEDETDEGSASEELVSSLFLQVYGRSHRVLKYSHIETSTLLPAMCAVFIRSPTRTKRTTSKD
jgi:hypothetical protein